MLIENVPKGRILCGRETLDYPWLRNNNDIFELPTLM